MTGRPAWRVRVLAVLLVAASLELVCWAFFSLARDRILLPESNPARYTHQPGAWRGLVERFEPTLGWVMPGTGPDGARRRPVSFGPPALAAFGDSFTYCTEVGDDGTWEHWLGQALGRDVENFGVGGYGPDQALLRYRALRGRLASRRVALGFVYENINRLVNRYRPFYQFRTGLPLTKPMFVVAAGRLELRPNPIRSVNELRRLEDPDFVAQLALEDYWYRRPALPRLGFPYCRLPLSPSLWTYVLEGRARGENQAPAQVDLWGDPAVRALFFAVLDAFRADVAADGREALLLVFPAQADVADVRAGRQPTGQAAVMAYCEQRRVSCFDGVAALARSSLPESRRYMPGGHLSSEANREVALALRAFLER